MVLPLYADPRLAALYDTANPGGEDYDFYLAALGKAPARVLGMGCSTGRLARAFAAAGHQTSGAEPSPAMPDVSPVPKRSPGFCQRRQVWIWRHVSTSSS